MSEEYLTAKELAARIKVSQDTIAERRRNGTWKRGVHYYHRRGMRPLFIWSAIEKWMREEEQEAESTEPTAAIPMARGYSLGGKSS